MMYLALSLLAVNLASAAAFFKPPIRSSSAATKAAPVRDDLLSLRGGGAKEEEEAAATSATKRQLKAGDLALAGGIATMIGDIALHPVDCIKTLQQSDAGAGLSLVGASRKIMADQGVGGFYSGLGTYVTADGGAGAIKFATYEALKQWIGDRLPEEYSGAALFGCAAAAYAASSVVLIPGELIKQRLQMGMADSVGGAISSIWKSGGIGGFFAGSSGVWFRDVPYTMMELGLYDNIKALCVRVRNNLKDGEEGSAGSSQLDEIIAAAIAGGVTGYLTNPMDLVKTKMMLNPSAFAGFGDAWRRTMREGGIAGLFAGAGARVSYIMPFCTFYLPVYEIIKRKLETVSLGGGAVLEVRGGAQARSERGRRRQIASIRGGGQESVRAEHRHPLRGDRCFVSF
eukprot:CAMPEP_0172545178 /NCGR_PEP_ID=MMETSP1067-20121228/15165_1 /TAXON_ID=265564 ORGANISM="Thalassiosira punctigera, Strain Tpunct2005C2" /NCGR_SAMPLE_ID=MMETSP1067 /ASSEMBLY_ACC=CAM_ASM_000444 /LENGTH=399 /DNA_ID=CAMNT_0013331877 /DNA_START=91 /DNA_END=1290 /DNA_ORIENTATION=-